MKPPPFTLHRPSGLEEAAALLAEFGPDGGLVIAGGQSLVPMMALRVAYPPHLVDVNGIPELATLRTEGDALVIGACVRHARFHEPVVPGVLGRLLSHVVGHIAHAPIRTRGTFGGSVAHADPSSEWCLVTATLGGTIGLKAASKRRDLEADDYFLGAMSTAREADEILTEVRLPLLSDATRFGFYEFNRRAGDFALGMALAVFEADGERVRNVRIGLGGIEDRPRRLAEAERLLEGREPSPQLLAEACAAIRDDLDPVDDAATPAEYRRDLAGVVVRRALEAALGRPQDEGRKGTR
jgi:carbon-monoxide dehydrogenase medium subunit